MIGDIMTMFLKKIFFLPNLLVFNVLFYFDPLIAVF
jgi:hypothetical protein